MKNQYVGDVGDYGKYSLLRFFANNGVKIGVNWYLTENDVSKDGKHTTYLKKEDNRRFDSVIFDGMQSLVYEEKRNVLAVEELDLIPGAIYYNKQLSTTSLPWNERRAHREQWHRDAVKALKQVQLIFVDPDNGTINARRASSRNAEKYTLQSEIQDYYKDGKNVVYYCQKARRSSEKWNEKKREMLALLPDARIFTLTFHRGTQRSYIFVVHPKSAAKYEKIIDKFLTSEWSKDKKPLFEKE